MGSVVRHSIALALVAVLLSVGVAFAGHGATVTHFTALYPEGGVCKGERIVKDGHNGFVKDIERCVQPADFFPLEPGRYSLWSDEVGGWFSDYEAFSVDPTDPICLQDISAHLGFCVRIAVSGTLEVTKGPHKTKIWHIIAYY